MNKTVKYATNGALIIGIGNAILNAFNQLNNQDESNSFNWNEFFKAFGKGALLGGASGLAIGAMKDNNMNNILNAIGGTAGLITSQLIKHTTKIEWDDIITNIQTALIDEFNNDLHEPPLISGSHSRGTSILNSDVDIVLKFNNNSSNINIMREKLEDFLNNKFEHPNLINIRSQDNSIGLLFKLEDDEKRFDIVPMRDINNGKGDMFIFSTDNYRRKKTNIEKQKTILIFTEKQKKIIRLLKVLKLDNNLRLKSIYIEHVVLRAYKDIPIPKGLENALFAIIEYIGINITKIRIVDPANKSNIISNLISKSEKIEIQNFCLNMIEEIRRDEKNILDYFEI